MLETIKTVELYDTEDTEDTEDTQDTQELCSITVDLDKLPIQEMFLQIEYEIIFVHCDEIIC